MSKQLLLGDEAIAQAALDAGLSGVYAYPGTPSTEITEYIQMAPITTEQNIHNRWCANEKTAMEAALVMSSCALSISACKALLVSLISATRAKLFSFTKRLNTRSFFSGSMPHPVSLT